MSRTGTLRLLALITLAVVVFSTAEPAMSATPTDFAAASNSINGAYLAVSQAQEKGGNVTGLVVRLNEALGLLMEAGAKNSTDPVQAALYLQNATSLARSVALEAPGIGRAGAAARTTQEYVSVGSAIAIVVVAAALYVFGERIYHSVWLRLYSGHLVKKVG